MNLPNLPTDNLYKFIALSGIALTLVCVYIVATQYADLQRIKSEFVLERQLVILNAEGEPALLKRMKRHSSLIEWAGDLAAKGDISPTEREEYVKSAMLGMDEVVQMINANRDALAKIDADTRKLDETSSRMYMMFYALGVLAVMGILISIVGFRLWYIKFQRISDELLRLELDIQRKNLIEAES